MDSMKNSIADFPSELKPFKAFVDAIPAGIAVAKAPEYRFIMANCAAQEAFGYSSAEISCMPTGDIYWNPADREYILKLLAAKGRVADLEIRLKKKDGTFFWAKISIAPLTFEGHTCLVCSFIDITPYKMTTQILLESETKYRNLVKHASTMLYNIEIPSGRFLEVNEVMSRILGYSRDELLHMTIFDILDERQKRVFLSRMGRVADRKPGRAIEFRARTRDGQTVWGLMDVTFRKQAGEITGATVIAQDITERKLAEEKQRESEALFRSLVEMSPLGIFVQSSMKLDYVNPAFLRLVGAQAPEELLGTDLLGMVAPEFHGIVTERIRRLEETARMIPPREMEYLHKDGHRIPVEVIAGPVRFRGRSAHLVFVHDITERRHADAKIRARSLLMAGMNSIFQAAMHDQTKERLASICLEIALILTQSNDGFIGELQADGMLDDLATSNYGLEFGDSSGSGIFPEVFSLRRLYDEVISANRSVLTNDPGAHPLLSGLPGEGVPVSSLLCVPLAADRNARGVIAVANREDGYTQEDREMLELLAPAIAQVFSHLDLGDRLKASEEKYRNLFECMDEMVAVYRVVRDEAGTVIDRVLEDANTAYIRSAGACSPAEIRGKTAGAIYTQEWAAQTLGVVKKAMEQGTPETVESSRFGMDVIATIVPLDDDRYLVSNRDITSIKETERRVRQQANELLAANQNLEAFAHSVSHDLRNPLHSILACCDVMRESLAGGDEDGHKALEHVVNAAERMSQVIADLMLLSRVTQHDLQIGTVDLSRMAGLIISELQKSEPHRKIDALIAPGITVEADERLVRILMENLLRNAWKFTAKTAEARIEFGRQNGSTPPVFYIRDNGAGFDMAKADRLFKPFQRLHSRQEYAGTGVGLTIVKRIAERHGGSIWAEAEKDRGATFRFTITAE